MRRRLFLFALVCAVGCNATPPDAATLHKMDAKSLFQDAKILALVRASEDGDVDRIKQLIKDGVDPNAKGQCDVTPIMRAFLAKNKPGFKALLESGADPNILDIHGFAVTNMAAENEDPEWLKDALAHRGDPNLVNVGNRFYPGQTPLFDAVNRGRVENMRLLVKAGANVNHQSARGERVLYFAHNQTYEIVLMLLEAGAAYKYPGFDLVEWMNLDIGNDLFRWDDKGKEWFNKTKSFLEKKGERFDEPPTKKAVK